MLDNLFKADEKIDEVVVAPVVPTPAPVAPVASKVSTAAKKFNCTNCEDSGFSCSVCGYNKP